MTVPRETAEKSVRPLLFRRDMRVATGAGAKKATRRILAATNSQVQPGAFGGLDLESGRARRDGGAPQLRARCTFESGRVRVVTVSSLVHKGDLFWVKAGRYTSRAASELTLEVLSVDIARVQDMTEKDAIEEGVELVSVPPRVRATSARDRFAWLWDAINGGGSWAANPWVWIYRYRTHHENVDDYMERLEK